MLLRIQADLLFTDQKHYDAVWQAIKENFPYTVTSRPGTNDEERSQASCHPCNHDKQPAEPCVPHFILLSPLT